MNRSNPNEEPEELTGLSSCKSCGRWPSLLAWLQAAQKKQRGELICQLVAIKIVNFSSILVCVCVGGGCFLFFLNQILKLTYILMLICYQKRNGSTMPNLH